MRKVLFVRRPIVQVALVILVLAVVAVVFTRAQDRAWATSATVTYNTLPASGAVSETYNTLKVYGDGDWPKQPGEPPGNMGAGSGIVSDEITGLLAEVQPYTDTLAIFNPQLPQAPRKDSITWNPLFMSRRTLDENQGLYGQILASGDASEKVWFRMWYEPEHWDKDLNANGKLDRDDYGQPLAPVNPTRTIIDEWYPAIMQEFTYLLMEPQPLEQKPEPTYGQAGGTRFVFPVGMRYADLFDPYGYGLTSLDGNFDGIPDIVHVESERTLEIRTGIAADFDGDGNIEDLDDGNELSGDELVVFRLEFLDPVPLGGYVQFLDHLVRLEAVFDAGVSIKWWYTGHPTPAGPRGASIALGRMLLLGTGQDTVEIPAGGGNTGVPPGPFFVYLESVDRIDGTARLIVGRALGATHTAMEDIGGHEDLNQGDPWFLKRFYVDGHEYNVVAIKTQNETDFQFITIRTPVAKVPVTIEQHSVRLQDYPVEEPLSVMPPYNFEHYILKDVQAITAFDTWEGDVAYLGGLVGPVPPILQKNGPFPYVGVYPDVRVEPYDDPREVYLRYVDEDANPQLLGELKEKYGERFIEGGVFEVEAEDATTVTTDGTWSSWSDPQASGDELLYSVDINATMSYTFTGSSITLIHNTQDNAGIANITIDGTPYPDVNMCAPGEQNWKVATLIASGLSAGSHTIEVGIAGGPPPAGCSGFNVLVDAFRVQQMGEEDEFWYVEQWWTRPWEFTEFVLPDIQSETDLYLLTSAFTASQSEYLQWIQGVTDPLRYNLRRDAGTWVHDTTVDDMPTGWRPRVKFWFDPAEGGKKYKGATGIRIYGRENEGAGNTDVVTDTVVTKAFTTTALVEVPPYTDPWAPFNPQLSQAPEKDSLTFNPAYMDEMNNGGEPLSNLYASISTEDSPNAREKVFFRMWYEPDYLDDILEAEITGLITAPTSITPTEVYTFPALVQEFTYMFLDNQGSPSHSPPGTGWLAFPIGTTADELPAPDPATGTLPPAQLPSFGYGLTTFSADFDEGYDIVAIHSEQTISETTLIPVDLNCNGKIDQLDEDGQELSGDELVVFVLESVTLDLGESAMFLDHMVTLDGVTWASGEPSKADLKFWYTGGGQHPADSLHPDGIGTRSLEVGSMAVLNKTTVLVIEPGGNNLGCEPLPLDGAWFAYLKFLNTDSRQAELTIGRALGATHSAMRDGRGFHDMTPGDPWYLKRFYVDGHEYNVVAIKTVPADSEGEEFEFKYITIRTPVPKVNFINYRDSQKLEGYNLGTVFGVDTSIISVMPPFNYAHTRMVDIQRVEEGEFAHPDYYNEDCVGEITTDVVGGVLPLQIQIVDEDTEPQFFGELKEKLWPDSVPNTDRWSTEQFHTLPDQYTDLDLPAGQLYLLTSDWRSDQSWVHYYGCDPTDGYLTHLQLSDLHTDILTPTEVISFTVDSTVITNTYRAGPLRVKFWYDPDDPDGLYVGTWETTPTCTATASATSPVCEGEDIVFTGGPGGMEYSWTGPAGFSSTDQNPTRPNATLAMSGTYTLTVTNDSCTATATTDVTVNEKPTATASYNSPVLEGETLKLYGGPPGMDSSWTGPDSFSSTLISPTVSTSATTAMAGTYQLTVTNTNGCRDTASIYVTVVATDENQGYFDPQHLSASYCTTTTVQIRVNVTDSFQGGEIVLEYDPTCADVTGWVRNGGVFTEGRWNSDNLGQEWIVFAAGELLTGGEYLIGTLTIHCVSDSPDGCDTALDFADPSVLTDDWGSLVPIAWVDGTFGCGLGVCGDVAPVEPGCDGIVNSQDVTLLLNYVGESPDHDTYYLCCDWCGDVAPVEPGCDGIVNSQDFTLLLNYVGESPDHPTYYLCCQDGGGGAPRAVSAAADNEVNLVPQESSAPFGETTEVEIWADATSFQGGEIVLEYNSDCADVTNWVRNEDDFLYGTWNSDNLGEERIVFAAEGLLTGDYLIGTLTIRGAYEEGCATLLDFVDPSLLTDDWGREIPATWTDGTFRSVKTYKVYLPLVMKSSQ